MVQRRSILKSADNTGAKKLMVIGIPGAGNKRYAKLSDVVTCVVKEANPAGQVKNHEIVRALIVRTKKEFGRRDGSYIRFSDNAAVVLDKGGLPKGTRVFGPIAREIRERGYSKIASQAQEIV